MNNQKTILKAIFPENNFSIDLIVKQPEQVLGNPSYIVRFSHPGRKNAATIRYSGIEAAIEKFDEILEEYKDKMSID